MEKKTETLKHAVRHQPSSLKFPLVTSPPPCCWGSRLIGSEGKRVLQCPRVPYSANQCPDHRCPNRVIHNTQFWHAKGRRMFVRTCVSCRVCQDVPTCVYFFSLSSDKWLMSTWWVSCESLLWNSFCVFVCVFFEENEIQMMYCKWNYLKVGEKICWKIELA